MEGMCGDCLRLKKVWSINRRLSSDAHLTLQVIRHRHTLSHQATSKVASTIPSTLPIQQKMWGVIEPAITAAIMRAEPQEKQRFCPLVRRLPKTGINDLTLRTVLSQKWPINKSRDKLRSRKKLDEAKDKFQRILPQSSATHGQK